ncbi:asparagine synthase (glutamine-hydrolyzing) [Longitalea luteola]|uniref:asparagine synthase (glutamine-hydrolyzing) n=1 Tax=Longitalea luteola TaxID=2812563 RepID=UPI001A956BE2|nr:asparagine synthase (glutamine-hydrolyzing) [Longitalea luteola]
MCGFAGFYLYKHLDVDKTSVLRSMGNQIAHRGPDDEQLCMQGNLGIIFKRLSIVDPEGGRQPLQNEDGTIKIIVNGEIYNYRELMDDLKQPHRFYTRSDCEVLIHLYEERGIDFLQAVNGMFALALWDQNKGILLLARDRLGIKPLYYSNSGSRLLFGSEIKALLPFPDCPREFNWYEALNTHKKRFVDDNYEVETCFKGIRQLNGGQYLLVRENENEITVRNYWQLLACADQNRHYEDKAPDQLIREYYELLNDSVRLMLLGDVDIGLFLSGGIDSSAIAALAAKTQKIKTFSVLNPDTLESEDAVYGNRVANELGLVNYQVNITYNSYYHDAAFWKKLVWQCETYECGTEQLFKYELYSYIRSAFPELRIVLLGQGSDEFNGGYVHKYVNEASPGKHNKWVEFEQTLHHIEQGSWLSGINQGISSYHRFMNRDYLAALKNSAVRTSPWYGYLNMHAKNLQLYQLLHEDRTAMANSIENRVPFLDHRLVEFMLQVPQKYFPRLFWNKNILREAMKHDLSAAFCHRPKVPFIFDNKNNYSRKVILDIITANDHELIDYALGDSHAKHDVLNRKEIDRLINQVKTDTNHKGIDELRFLVNMGILSRKVQENDFDKITTREKIQLDRTAFCNQVKQEQSAFDSLVKKHAAKTHKNKKEQDLLVAGNVTMLTDLQGQWYVFLDGDLVEIIEEATDAARSWIRVLQHALQHSHNITESLAALNTPQHEVSAALLKSLEAKVIYQPKKKKQPVA